MSRQKHLTVAKKQHRIIIDLNRLDLRQPKSFKVIGLPGTGKTTFLLNSLGEMLRAGISLRDIIYCSHTKAAVHEVQERLKSLYPDQNGVEATVRTIHSVCNSLVNQHIKPKSIGTKQKNQFLRGFIAHTHEFDDLWSEFEEAQEEGSDWNYRRYREDDLFYLSTSLQLSIPSKDPIKILEFIEEFWYKQVNRNVERDLIRLSFIFHQQYLHFKSRNDYFEFEDLLSYVHDQQLYPNKRILIMDEFQDCSPLQFEIYKLWASRVELSIIAGDPNQAIYGFQNSSPHFLISHPVTENEIILNRSYRLPPAIVELAQHQMSSSKYLSEYKSDISITHEGEIIKIGIKDLVLQEGSTFILTRTNSQLQKVSELLTNMGILHVTKRSKPPASLIKEIRKWYPVLFRFWTNTLKSDDLFIMINEVGFAPPADNMIVVNRNHVFRYEDRKEIQRILRKPDRAELLKIVELDPETFLDIIMKQLDKRCYPVIRRGLEKGVDVDAAIQSINNTELLTIHQSKGKEADNVVIIDKATYYELQGQEDSEEERRVWYVAITRAKKRLFIVNMDNDKTQYLGIGESDGENNS